VRILIVDDDVDVRSLLEDSLVNAGYQITIARDGAEGLEKLRDSDIDLVITDLIMPEKNGLDFILELRAEFEERVKVIAMTGGIYDFPKIGDVDGADRFVSKPFHVDKILELVSELVSES